jgi:Protein of unknown function (DUF4197)
MNPSSVRVGGSFTASASGSNINNSTYLDVLFHKRNTSQELITAFTPSVQASLDRTNATRYYADIANTYNRLPTGFNKVNPDLTDYVVQKTVDALFDQIAKEEANIRANPLARTTEIIKKVFGGR